LEDLADAFTRLRDNVYLVFRCTPPPDVLNLIVEAVERVYSIERPRYAEIVVECGEPERIGDLIVEYEGGLTHEALSGFPRIHIDLYRFLAVPERLKRAMLVHELVHSILHGSPEYYIGVVREPRDLLILHIAYTVVKDLEVSLWMEEKGFSAENDVLRSYYDAARIECVRAEEIMDEGRRLALYAASGRLPIWKCGELSKRMYTVLRRLLGCTPRPWACRNYLVETISGLV